MNKIVLSNKHLVLPFSRSTFEAFIFFHFHRNNITSNGPGNLDVWYERCSKVELFEFEFILKCIIKNLYIFENNLSTNAGITICNLLRYGLDAYLGKYLNNSSRGKITSLFRQALINSI